MFVQADATRLPFADDSVSLVFTSPPYIDARTYGIGAGRHCLEWIDWMLDVVAECVRVSRGLVLINCAGLTLEVVVYPADGCGCEKCQKIRDAAKKRKGMVP